MSSEFLAVETLGASLTLESQKLPALEKIRRYQVDAEKQLSIQVTRAKRKTTSSNACGRAAILVHENQTKTHLQNIKRYR